MPGTISIFMCGDVMTGRGIDQILPYPGNPLLHESYMKNARGYVELAERESGRIPHPVSFSSIWGDALGELERIAPDLKIINLETSITKSNDYWKGKPVHYRMNPLNIPCITAAGIDYCSLANNHTLDWGYAGLTETIETLKKARVECGGAGGNLKEAETPVLFEIKGKGRVIVFSFGSETSGIPQEWAARENRPGVNFLKNLSSSTVRCIKERVQKVKKHGDIVIASLHWGDNWGYEIPYEQTLFAHMLIDYTGIDIVHGHSSHHVKGIEVYRERPIIYGCGDFLNDYEGINGYEFFRGDLGFMYFAYMEPENGNLVRFHMTPTHIKRFTVNRATTPDAVWLRDVLNREGKRFGTRVVLQKDNTLTLEWY